MVDGPVPGSLCSQGHFGTGPADAVGSLATAKAPPKFPRPRPINLIEHDDGKTVAFPTWLRRREVKLQSVPGGVRAEHRRSLRAEDQPGKQRPGTGSQVAMTRCKKSFWFSMMLVEIKA